VDIPDQPGMHDIYARFWYPHPGSIQNELKMEHCGGFRPLMDPETLANNRKSTTNWSSTRAASSDGSLHIQLNIVFCEAKARKSFFGKELSRVSKRV